MIKVELAYVPHWNTHKLRYTWQAESEDKKRKSEEFSK